MTSGFPSPVAATVGERVSELVTDPTQTTVAVLIVGGLGLAVVALGIYSGIRGIQNLRHWRGVSGASPLSDSASPGDVATVEGTVAESADGDSLSSRYEGAPCVAYACEVLDEQSANREDIYESAGGVIRDRSRTEEDAVPFLVDIDGRQVRVEASDANLVWRGIDFDSVSAGAVARNAGTLRKLWVVLSTLARSSHERRTYYEACLRPGDQVSVTGTVRRASDDVTLEPDDGVPLVVSTNPRLSVAGRYRNRGFSGVVGAVLYAGIGVGVLYALAGAL